jgi:hypothetical protein
LISNGFYDQPLEFVSVLGLSAQKPSLKGTGTTTLELQSRAKSKRLVDATLTHIFGVLATRYRRKKRLVDATLTHFWSPCYALQKKKDVNRLAVSYTTIPDDLIFLGSRLSMARWTRSLGPKRCFQATALPAMAGVFVNS